ncbi:MAG: hydrolase, partial [Pseudonocardia sp.]|nr:hydrolase [Pseudonocardia sp.]
MRRSGRLVVLMVVAALLGGTSTGLAQPTPPPNPSDDELQRSRDTVSQRAGEVGQLTSLLADLDRRADDLQAALAAQRETAEAALVDLESARDAAAQAVRRADGARIETEAASVAIVEAGARLDEFLTATYQRGLDTGPLALLTDATSPENLVTRAEFDDAVGRQQIAAQDGLERARAGKANADSTARAALEDAREREAAAEGAKATADAALAAADAAARAQAVELAAFAAERTGVQARLDTAESQDTGLRQQRERFDDWQRRIAAEQAARERAER